MPQSRSTQSVHCFLSCRSEVLMSFCCSILVAILIVTMASEESFYEMCDNVPCGGTSASERPAEIPCRYQEEGVRMLMNTWPDIEVPQCTKAANLSNVCILDTCAAFKDTFMSSKTLVQLELTCLRQILMTNGEFVTFGSICCSVCQWLVDYEEVFRTWASVEPKQSCGLFNCAKGNAISDDICRVRSGHIKAVQAFAILSTMLIGFLAIYHAVSAWRGSISKDNKSRIPLPRQLLVTQNWVHERAFFFHGMAGLFCLIAAAVMMATLARSLCDIRYYEYVRTGYGIRSFWFCMVIEFLFACNCFLKINTTKETEGVKAVPAQAPMRQMVPVAEASNPIDTNLQMDDATGTPVLSHSSGPREEPASVELRAMSPADVSLDVKDEPETSSTPDTTPKPPPALS